MNETIWEPVILSAAFDKVPAIFGEPVTIRVMVVDVFGKEQPELWYSAEIGSGEV